MKAAGRLCCADPSVLCCGPTGSGQMGPSGEEDSRWGHPPCPAPRLPMGAVPRPASSAAPLG